MKNKPDENARQGLIRQNAGLGIEFTLEGKKLDQSRNNIVQKVDNAARYLHCI